MILPTPSLAIKALAWRSRKCPHMAHRDGRRSDGQPSLSGHSGHGAIFGARRSVANDPFRKSRSLFDRPIGGTITTWSTSIRAPVSPPEHRGFGTTVVDSMAKLSLGGKVEPDYAPSGVMWRLTCPATNALERDLRKVAKLPRPRPPLEQSLPR
jgi:hypothetical protein